MVEELLHLKHAELEYGYLLGLFQHYKKPEEKIKYLVKTQDLILVKRGVYVLAPKYQKLVSTQVLGELIYSPSYLSLESSLYHHQLIPEAIWGETSVSLLRSKSFKTPYGRFVYHNTNLQDFPWGVHLTPVDAHRQVRMASPLKALYDQIRFCKKKYRQHTDQELFDYLELLRVDFDEVVITKSDISGLRSAKSSRIKEFLLHMIDIYSLEIQP